MLSRELKINFKNLILWASVIIALFLIVFLIYPSIIDSDKSKLLNEMLKAFPKNLLEMYNMDIAGIDSVFGWFKTEGYTFLILIGGLYSAILGSTILVKEESDKTIEFLYSKPVTRSNIVTSKILCGVFNITALTLITTLFNLIGMIISDDLNLKLFLMLSLTPLLLYYSLFFVTLLISTFYKKTKKSMGIGIAFTLVSYFLQIIGSMGENVQIIKKFSLFELVSSRYIILNNNINYTSLLIGVVIIIVSAFFTYKIYNKKELS